MGECTVRRADVVSRREGAEVLVVDLESQTAHCLSGDVAKVWDAIEAPVPIEQIAGRVTLPPAAVEAALAQLRALGLLTARPAVSRRALARGAALGGAAVAAGVVSIPLPAAARANSSLFKLSKVDCPGGLINAVLGKPLNYRFELTGGRLAPSATYTFSFTYSSALLLGVVVPYTATETRTFTTDAGGLIVGAPLQFTTTNAYLGSMSQVTVVNTADTSDKNRFTVSPAILSC